MFGHAKGAFTGANSARKGYFDSDVAQATSSVFLDEIGELDPQIQVKLLRVLQIREYQRVGDSKTYRFEGKVIAATNRDLAARRLRIDRRTAKELFDPLLLKQFGTDRQSESP